jgi:hypothetical protein
MGLLVGERHLGVWEVILILFVFLQKDWGLKH